MTDMFLGLIKRDLHIGFVQGFGETAAGRACTAQSFLQEIESRKGVGKYMIVMTRVDCLLLGHCIQEQKELVLTMSMLRWLMRRQRALL